MRPPIHSRRTKLAALFCGVVLASAACGSSDDDDAATTTADPSAESSTDTTEATDTADSEDTDSEEADSEQTESEQTESEQTETESVGTVAGCDEIAALFVTRGSANADLDDPEVAATCEGENLIVTANGIPDFTYIETSPGQPRNQDLTYTIPASPSLADTTTAIPYVGSAAVTLGGIPIYGPTEGTGGDVDSLPGIISVCGSHNGPTGFHAHKVLASSETDCFFTPEEVAAAPQLVGYAFDGFPIYTGVDQYTSSWQLTDETLFATDTWAAHTYVEGSGDLDECNGLTDEDGNYAYYTTETFPYVLGCFAGVVDITGAGGGGGGGGGEGEEGADGERPERPVRDDDAVADDEDRPERPEPAEADDGDGNADEGEQP